MAGTPFRDQAMADEAWSRLASLVRADPAPLATLIAEAPNPDLALQNLERWLSATGNPSSHFGHLLDAGELGALLVQILGSGHHLADVLAQNPELGSLALDSSSIARTPAREGLQEEGARLISAAPSFSFQLDRLRFLKQKWLVVISVADLSRIWPEPTVWFSLSELAEAIMVLTHRIVWRQMVEDRLAGGECPVSIIAFGKLGGEELNYSSDIDLAYVIGDETPEANEAIAVRFCERFGRAIDEKMGRGALYRVDTRLRPFGRTGPILNRMNAVEAYYERYAEPWEQLALIRSRVAVVSDVNLGERWNAMRMRTCFRPHRGEWAIEEMLADRIRSRSASQPENLKLALGGIRDIEFYVQVLQLIHGHHHQELRARGTIDALQALAGHGIVSDSQSQSLGDAYLFLRQLEHRCQIVGDLQTHTLPSYPHEREYLARSMGLGGQLELEIELARHRDAVVASFASTFGDLTLSGNGNDREIVLSDSTEKDGFANWIDSLPAAASCYRMLCEDRAAFERADRIAAFAPVLQSLLMMHPAISERVLSGEWDLFGIDEASDRDPARQFRSRWLLSSARWVLEQGRNFGKEFAQSYDEALVELSSGSPNLSIIALGSYASGDLNFRSDADVIFLVESERNLSAAESAAQNLLSTAQRFRNRGAPFELDLRLRPEGRKGMLVSTWDGLRAYSADAMEPWERLALSRYRIVTGSDALDELLYDVVVSRPTGRDEMQSLLAMKQRIETERLAPALRSRHIKIGDGGLEDIDWMVQIELLLAPRKEPIVADMRQRLLSLQNGGQLDRSEVEALLLARTHHLNVRMWVDLMGYEHDVMPESPEQLDRLAAAIGSANGNAIFKQDQGHRGAVRSIYERHRARWLAL